MARKRERAVALVAALLFLGTSLGASVLVLVQSRQNHKAQDAAAQLQQQLQSQNTSSTNNSGGSTVNNGTLQNFTPIAKIDSLQAIDTTPGTGDAVKAGDTVTVKYTGAYASDGVIFDSSDLHGGQPISFGLSQVIKGWSDGIPGMKVGGKRRLLIPAAQAYGANPPSGVRANADMVFDVELIKIGQ